MTEALSMLLSRVPTGVAAIKQRFSGSDVTSRLVRGTFWASIGALVSRVFAMVSSIIVARLLGKEAYGEMGMVYSTMGMFGVFAGFGLGLTASKYIAEFRLTDPVRTFRVYNLTTAVSIVSGGLLMTVSYLLSPWLASHSLNRPDIEPLLQAGSLLLFFSTLAGVQQGALSGFEAFRKSARINLYQGIASPLITVPCVLLYGVQGAICALTISMVLTLLLCLVAVNNELRRNKHNFSEPFANCWMERDMLTRFALPSMLSTTLTIPVTWFTNTILVNSAGGYGELGLFNAANQWRQVIVFFPALLSNAMLPIMSQTHGQQDKSDYRRVVATNLKMIWVIALPVTVLMVTFGKPLAQLFGRQFISASSIISVLMVACFLNVVNGPVGTALTGAGKMWTGTVMNLGWAMGLVLFSYVLIPRFGGLGLAFAYLLAYFFHSIWQAVYVEMQLAPKLIQDQWPLILFSFLLLAVCTWLQISKLHSVVISILMVAGSALPMASLILSKYKQTNVMPV